MGSKNNKAGESKADKANKQLQKQQEAIQATEAKEVRSTPYSRSLGRGLEDTSKYSGNLKGAIERANFRNSVLGRNPALNQLADPLGRSGLTGEYNVTPGGMQDNIQGTLGSRDISQLGRMIDSGNFANLNEQAAANQLFGFNSTKGMGILDSIKYNVTNPEAKRGYQRLGNLAKGIGTLAPIQNVFRGMLGIDPVQMTEISPYNIGPGFSQYPDNFTTFTNPELEGMTENAIYSRLFNDVAPVQTGMFNPMQPGEDMINVMPMKNPFGNPFSPAIVSDEQKKAFNADFYGNALGGYFNQFPPEQLIGAGIDPNSPILQTSDFPLTDDQITGLEAQGIAADPSGIGIFSADSPIVQDTLQEYNLN